MAAPISDYAIIGDGRSVALVSRDGAIDWLCWPRFDSPSIFGALLDPEAGTWRIAPKGAYQATRRYLPDTNVLETRFVTSSGVVRLTDWMPVAREEDKRIELVPDHEILRSIECDAGEVELAVTFDPRPLYGRRAPKLRDGSALGIRVDTGRGLLVLRSDLPANGRLRAGESCSMSLTMADEWQAVLPPLGDRTRRLLARSVAWWREWVGKLTYAGPRRDAVTRSALALKLMVYAPTGAVVAAPTTSLPESLGRDLNWDYRFCWLRDASLTVRALFGLGFHEEATAFASWLLHSTRLTRPRLRVLYDLFGNPPAKERTLGHLRGYQGSRPVRVGNGARDQLQLDVYGEVVDAAAHFARRVGGLDRESRRMLRQLGDYVCRHWSEPDDGIWEPRSGARHNTHSRLLCWTALDRLIALHDEGHVPRVPVDEYRKHREAIRREIEERAWNPALESYVATLDGDDVDASLLLMSWYGFAEASSPRMKSTHRCIEQRLGAGHGLLYRYRTDPPGLEGAFGICGFWAVEHLALGGGTAEEALASFEELVALGNDVGLFAEETDPTTLAALGNFPQAFTHIGLISAARSLEKRLAS